MTHSSPFFTWWTWLAALFAFAIPALPCTCQPTNSNAKAQMDSVSVVFRGTVLHRDTLQERPEMKGRNRYATTFRVDEFWKGAPGRTVVIYSVDSLTDCPEDGGYKVGKRYLVYAQESEVRDVLIDTLFWYGWTDLLPKGTTMLIPRVSCMPGGEVSQVHIALKELGKGHKPQKD